MWKAIKRALRAAQEGHHPVPAHERRQLELAVAVLAHEARRADYADADSEESAVALAALRDIFGLDGATAAELLEHGREKAQHLTSFYAPLVVIKREFSMDQRIRVVEHLWRVSFADGGLMPCDDSSLS